MNYEIDKIPPEDVGDGLPNIGWRLRIILITALGNLAAWTTVYSLIR
jgi:hypothetical protein